MQVYRHMDIGTAKPSAIQRARLPHHLVDVVEPSEQFNAGQFVKAAEALAAQIAERGNVPVVSGGTAFYIRSLLYGLPESPPGSTETRRAVQERARREGQAALYEELCRRDPQARSRIQPNDRYRTTRALEVLESTGRSVFSFSWPSRPRKDIDFLVVGLDRDRGDLYARIEARVEAMFAQGLVAEVKGLLGRGYGRGDPGMRGIGYREFLDMQRGCTSLAQVRCQIAADSRRYAKRQLTFFRSIPGVTWLHPAQREEFMRLVDQFVGVPCAVLPGTPLDQRGENPA
jgi:tRNA dimethylallyltransferase